MKKSVLVICTGNSCRSQMAEGWLRYLSNGEIEVSSAGTHPCFVHPTAIEVMTEVGIDISHHVSKSLDLFIDKRFEYVVTVCDNAKEHCPIFPNAGKHLHMPFEDPGMFEGPPAERVSKFREVRDEIKTGMMRFLANELGLTDVR